MTITTLDAATIAKVTLLRLGTSTHATDMEQRYLELPFVPTEDGTGVVATAPANANIAPPGYYLMFLVNSAGVPSVAATVQVIP